MYANATCEEKRYLMCHLFHSPYIPRLHRAPGFRSFTDTNVAVPENRLWCMKQRSLGSLDSGIHRYHALRILFFWGFTDWLSVRFDIGFMARADAAKDHDDRSGLAQIMDYNRTVPRILRPDLGKRFADQVDPPVDTQIMKRPRGGFTRADEKQNPITLEDLSHSNTKNSSKSTRVTKRAMSSRPLSKDSEESFRVSTSLRVSGDL